MRINQIRSFSANVSANYKNTFEHASLSDIVDASAPAVVITIKANLNEATNYLQFIDWRKKQNSINAV